MLSFIQESKCNLSKKKQLMSEKYTMLNIVERIVENFDLWDTHVKDHELTFYRRFAEFLDCLFTGTIIKRADGETGSKNSKTAIKINKTLFHTSGASPTFAKKIDL
jgi:hypothetical protein